MQKKSSSLQIGKPKHSNAENKGGENKFLSALDVSGVQTLNRFPLK